MFKLALYLAFGIILHALFIGARFDPTNLLSWLWLFCWPVPVLLIGFAAALIVAAVNSLVEYIKGAMR